MVALPAGPGVYALLMHLPERTERRIGALGACRLEPGWYLYVGSARGAGGLRARVGRHLRRVGKRPHWHMDRLRPAVRIHAVWWTAAKTAEECAWVRAVAGLRGARAVLPGFGAGDSPLTTHLFAFDRPPDLDSFRALAGPAHQWVVPQALR
jgi:Uri superfamily endonuclease